MLLAVPGDGDWELFLNKCHFYRNAFRRVQGVKSSADVYHHSMRQLDGKKNRPRLGVQLLCNCCVTALCYHNHSCHNEIHI